jgi:hypothetical protein
MSGVRDRAAVVVANVLLVMATILREHPEFHRLARADIYRVLEPARPELTALLREEFHEIEQSTLDEIRMDPCG